MGKWNCSLKAKRLAKKQAAELYKILIEQPLLLNKVRLKKEFLQEYAEMVAEGRRLGQFLLGKVSTTKTKKK